MASLNNLLNPERKRLLVGVPQSDSPAGSGPPPSSASVSDDEAEPETPYNPLEHIPHPDCPDSLACLPDTDGRPQHTLPVILRCAILGAPKKRLTIRDIYAAMEEKYAYYRTAGPTWKQSVRHHLSLNRLFERQPRPATDPGFGSYWTVNLLAPPGTKRPRKRGKPNKDAGQPPKPVSLEPIIVEEDGMGGQRVTRGGGGGHGRLLQAPPPTGPVTGMLHAADATDDEDEDMEEDELASQVSECESEEKLLHPFERRQSLSGRLTPYDASAGCHISPRPLVVPPMLVPAPPLPASPQTVSPSHGSTDDIVDRLQMEMANLRRQSAEAISMSMRLSDQLAHAETEMARARSALESTQQRLREETERRRLAERNADHALQLRRVAEEALRDASRRV
ncbi:U3 small nucleolar RNA-associated protein [Mycena kentingensis (nom. inval.)]|nr:U3 small nucleolar RNA-associated protein [Mycena kentingensis (nom. inval.)]